MEFDGVPIEHLTDEGRRYQLEKIYHQNLTYNSFSEQLQRLESKMADIEAVLESFRAAVDKELLDDRAQNDLIELLRGQVADAEGLVQAARDGEASAKAQVDALLVELEQATERLSENDMPEPPTDPETGDPVEPEAPEEPVVPEEPTPGDEPVVPGPIEPSPVEPEVPGEPVPGEPTEPTVPTEPNPDEGGGTEGGGEEPDVTPAPEDEEEQPEGPTPTPDNPFAV